MVSLSVTYGVTLLLASAAAIGAAFAGNYMYAIGQKVEEEPPTEEPPVAESGVVESTEQNTTQDEKDNIQFTKNIVGGVVRTYTPQSDQHDKVVYTEKIPTDFFEDQMAFYKTLSNEEKLVLASYTFRGDNIINSKLRNTPYDPSEAMKIVEDIKKDHGESGIQTLFGVNAITNENLKSSIDTYVLKFQQIFEKVPPIKTEIKLFRGTDIPTPEFKGVISTTYDPMGRFVQFSGTDCCVYELTVMPNVKALWLEPIAKFKGESEILLSNNITFNLIKETKKEVWSILTNLQPIEKSIKTVYEGTVVAA